LVAQQVGEAARIRHVEDRINAWLPEIRIYQDHRSPGLGKDDREIRRRDGLTLTWSRTRHEECSHRGIERSEFDIRAQGPVGLRKARAREEETSELVELLSPSAARHPRDRAQGTHARHVLDRIRVPDAIIQLFRNERYADDHEQPQSRGEQRVEENPR